jgi:site-specific DNA-methyltransferase (adenine-specific)
MDKSLRCDFANCDLLEYMPKIGDCSIQCVMTDPPYLYLKNQKLDRPFDEKEVFSQCKRVLKDEGFIIFFGRGESFYRWNTILEGLGFVFKEEIIWDKHQSSSPVSKIARTHESIAIWTKKKGMINKVKIPYLETKGTDLDLPSVISDLKHMRSILNNTKSLNAVLNFLQEGKLVFEETRRSTSTTISSQNLKKADPCASVMNAIQNGMNEKSIIRCASERFTAIHPTQKPVALLKRLLNLTAKSGDTIFDGFSGSGSTAIASLELGMNFIGCEIDSEYYSSAKKRIEQHIESFTIPLNWEKHSANGQR